LFVVASAIIGAVVLTGAVTVLLDGGRRFSTGGVAPLNVFGILAWQQSPSSVSVLRVSVAAIVVTAIVLGARVASLRIALVAAMLFFVGATVHVRNDVLRPWARPFERMHVLPDAVRALPVHADVAYLRGAYVPQVGNFYQQDLLDRWAGFWDGRGRSPAPLVIGTKQAPAPGALMVFPEPGLDQALWVLPGPLADQLSHSGFTSAPLTTRRAILRAPTRVSASAGDDVEVEVRVTHPAGGAPWPSVADVVDGKGSVRAAATWPDGASATSVGDLSRTLLPGESTTINLVLHAPTKPGTYDVTVTLLEDPGQLFSGAVTITVRVR
jgi:hypothetical protein